MVKHHDDNIATKGVKGMKIGRLRLLSVFLALAMLCCCIPATLFGAAADGGTVAKATKATLTSMESFVVGGSDRGAVYQIALYLAGSRPLARNYPHRYDVEMKRR